MKIDQMHEMVRGANPVPDLAVLELIETRFLPDRERSGEMSSMRIEVETPEPRRPRIRRGLLIGAAAALVVIVGVALTFMTGDGPEVAGSDSRLLQLTFNGEECSYEGPTVLSAGEVEIVYHNESSEGIWFDFVRLDEGRTIQEIINDLADTSISGEPAWVVGIFPVGRVAPNGPFVSAVRTVVPGLHAFVCGTWAPYQGYFGSELTVTP